MKRVLIGDNRETLLSTLEVMLKHWGYRVTVSSRPEQVKAFLEQTAPDLLVIGARMLAENSASLGKIVESRLASLEAPLLVLADDGMENSLTIPCEPMGVPVDLFALFEIVQKYLEKIPRKNLRLTVKLPSLFSSGETSCLAEVMSISAKGMFVKTGIRIGNRDPVRVIVPLLGMKKELEIAGKVLYCVLPGPENNYLQGVGIEFTELDKETQSALQDFIENRFLGELTDRQGGDDISRNHLKDAKESRGS